MDRLIIAACMFLTVISTLGILQLHLRTTQQNIEAQYVGK